MTTGYLIGLVFGIIVFLAQNFKPTSGGFRIMFLVTTIVFTVVMAFVDWGYWHLLAIPAGVMVLAFISAVCFPYMGNSVAVEYNMVNGRDYYSELEPYDHIGKVEVPAFKQTYDRIIEGIIRSIVYNQQDLDSLWYNLYSNNFYPISEATKEDVVHHIEKAISKTADSSKHGSLIIANSVTKKALLFNAFVSVMRIHEEATDNIERLKKR